MPRTRLCPSSESVLLLKIIQQAETAAIPEAGSMSFHTPVTELGKAPGKSKSGFLKLGKSAEFLQK
jgi:hypothetical protein